MSVFAGVSYDFPLNNKKTVLLSPGLSFRYGINDLIKDYSWKTHSFSATLALSYSPEPYREPVKIHRNIYHIDTVSMDNDMISMSRVSKGTETSSSSEILTEDTLFLDKHYTRTDTLFIPKFYELTADIDIVGIDSLGREHPIDTIRVEELHYSQMHPLLNYVFFDENSSEIDERYVKLRSKSEFDMSKFDKFETLKVYYNILNIIGERLSHTPKASITLTGCNSASGVEQGNKDLSESRASSVKNYLRKVWGIADRRIKIRSRELPSKPSTPVDQPDKRAENQRVEIRSNNSNILANVIVNDTMRVSDIKYLKFKKNINSEAGFDDFTINLKIGSEQYSPFKNIRNLNMELTYKFFDLQNHFNIQSGYLNYGIGVRDIKGQNFSSRDKSIPVKVLTIKMKQVENKEDKGIEKYNLVLFDFNSDHIAADNMKIIKFIKSRINKNSVVNITGYTDRTGGEEHNKYLSLIRAEAAYNKLRFRKAKYKGVGSDVILYDNAVPEGRFYSRTVEILIENPINIK